MSYRILLVGGGSGGHVYPLVAVAQAIREKAQRDNLEVELMMIGDNFIERAAKESSIHFKKIFAGKFRRYFSFESINDLFKIPLGFIQSFWHLFWFMPDIVFSKGGYASITPVIVAKLYRISVYIHESDSVPGLTNLILGKMADKIFLSFKITEKYFKNKKTIFTGNPVRKSLAQGDKNVARDYFDLHETRPTVLILGGSQGAKIINEIITSGLIMVTQKFNIIHQCGESQIEFVKKNIGMLLKEEASPYAMSVKTYYRYYAFLDESQLALAYSLADIIVSRAGSGTLFEIAQLGKPAVIIPIFRSPADHQRLNAFEFNLSGGYLIEEPDFNRDSLVHTVENLLKPELYLKISEKIKTFATPDAANKIAEEMLKK